MATLGAPFEVGHVLKQFAARVPEVEARGEAVVDLAGRPFAIRRAFVEEARAQEQAPRIAALGRALLVMHAPTDGVVGVENARAIFEAARRLGGFSDAWRRCPVTLGAARPPRHQRSARNVGRPVPA